MTTEKEYFIHLLSCFLNGDQPSGKKIDWQKIYNLADIHDVQAIISQQIKLLPNDYMPQGKVKSYFNQLIGRTIQNYAKKESAKAKIKAFFDSNKIDHIFVKGAVISQYYPVPEFRTSGDIDVIVRNDCFENIVPVIKSSNLIVESIVTETITVKIDDVSIEIHKYADVKSNYFNNIFALCNNVDGCTYELCDYDHLLYVICHMCKHIQYRGAGIRMLMDVDVLIRSIDNFNQEKLVNMCNAAGIEKSAKVLLSLCNFWFNTSVKSCVDFKTDQDLLNAFEKVMLDGGSFGYVTNSIPLNSVGDSRAKTVLNLAFPSKDFLKKAYPYYDKNSLLLPVARFNRLYDAATKKRKQAKNSMRQLMSDENISKTQSELLVELGIKNVEN